MLLRRRREEADGDRRMIGSCRLLLTAPTGALTGAGAVREGSCEEGFAG